MLHQSYTIDNVSIKNFIDLDEVTLLNILEWRNSECVKKWMYKTDIISKENHMSFCESLKYNYTMGYWLMSIGAKQIGVFNLTKYDVINQTGEFGFYLNPKYFMSGLGIDLFYIALDLFFSKFQLNSIYGFVKCSNASAMLMNDFFGLHHMKIISIEAENYSERVITKEEWTCRDLKYSTINKSFISYINTRRKMTN